MKTITLNQYAFEVRCGDIYSYVVTPTDQKDAWLIYMNDEYVGFVQDEEYAKEILEKIQYYDEDEIIRIIVKRESRKVVYD